MSEHVCELDFRQLNAMFSQTHAHTHINSTANTSSDITVTGTVVVRRCQELRGKNIVEIQEICRMHNYKCASKEPNE